MALDIIKSFKNLSYKEQLEILNQLKTALSQSRPILEHRAVTECPHCKSKIFKKHANYNNGATRYKCSGCKKTFNELTGTCIHKIQKKDLWDSFISLMLESKTIRKIVEILGISRQTALNWRHKILSSLNEFFTKRFKGVVETDDAYFRFNEKGTKGAKNGIIRGKKNKRGVSNEQVSVMVSSDRYGTMDLVIIKRGRITKDALIAKLNLSRFNKENIIYSDKSQIIINLFSELGLEHKTFKSNKKSKGVVNVNVVNNMIGRLRRWIKFSFKNVATKYLQNYLNWFMILEIFKGVKNPEDNFLNSMLLSGNAHESFKLIDEVKIV
jgi:transposase-like protein